MTYLAVQLIRISYGDDHRGRVHAEQRARVRGLPIAPIEGGVFHRCSLDAWSGYEPRTEVSGLPIRDDHVWLADLMYLRAVDDRLVFLGDRGAGPSGAKALLDVARGSWGRVVLNAKQWGSETKWLTEFVVNAGMFDQPPPGEIFLGHPAAERDVRHDFLRNGYR